MPEGRQKLLGSSLPAVSMRCLYAAAAQGWKGTSFRSAAMLIRYLSPGTSHIPDRSGLPSGNRGAFAERSTLPSLVRGAPGFLVFNHWADNGVDIQSRLINAMALQRGILYKDAFSDGDYTPAGLEGRVQQCP